MSRHELGVDLIDIERIAQALQRHPQRFRRRVLTDREDRYCGERVERVAGRWAAKEAVSKVLGLGVRGARCCPTSPASRRSCSTAGPPREPRAWESVR
jgi:holo-[acyl-carrier-protein] synthase